MRDKNNLPLRRGVGCMLVNNENKVFVGKRIDNQSEAWQMPQGGIEENEDASIAIARELEEETSVINATIIAETKNWLEYELPEYLIGRVWGGKYRGQTQKWFLMKFD